VVGCQEKTPQLSLKIYTVYTYKKKFSGLKAFYRGRARPGRLLRGYLAEEKTTIGKVPLGTERRLYRTHPLHSNQGEEQKIRITLKEEKLNPRERKGTIT